MQRFLSVIHARQKAVVIGVLAVAAVLVANVAWSFYSAQREAGAQARLSEVIDRFQVPAPGRAGFERIIADAQKIRVDYPSSPAARLAQYYIAISEESLGNTPRAIAQLESLIAEGDRLMKPLAQFALATIYANHGDEARALEVHKQLEAGGAYATAGSDHHAKPEHRPKAHE